MIEKEGGILTALYIILGIIAFFVILLSIKFVVTVHYEDDVTLSVSWLFLKFGILPPKENKKPKKEKKKMKIAYILKCIAYNNINIKNNLRISTCVVNNLAKIMKIIQKPQ